MARTARRLGAMLTLFVLASMLQLAGASSASAATTCKSYDRYPHESGTISNVRVCAAPGADFPGYSGWGRVVDRYAVTNPCGFSMLPYDYDDPIPMVACLAVMPAPVSAWRWTGGGWMATSIDIGRSAYLAPYAAGWRWAWTKETGWVAIEQKHAAFRWYA